MRHSVLFPLAGILTGAALGLRFADHPHAQSIAVTVFIAASAAAFLARSRNTIALAAAILVSFAAGSSALAIGAWRAASRPSLRVIFDRAVADGDHLLADVTGTLASDASISEEGVLLRVDVQTIEIRGRGSGRRQEALTREPPAAARGGILVTVAGSLAPGTAENWRRGRRVRVAARLRRPSRHLDPGVPDEEQALARRGVTLVGSVKSAALVGILQRAGPLAEIASAIRARTRTVIQSHVSHWCTECAGIVTAILIGDRAGLTDDVERSLQEAGTYHVIAISGGNVAIFATVTIALFTWTALLGRSAMLTAVAVFLAYGAIVEGGASVDRAIVMAVLYFLARALDHRVDAAHGLAVAAALLVAIDPLSILDAGFLLSFGATAGILLLSPAGGLRGLRPVFSGLLSMMAASAAAELALLPVAALTFERVTFAGLPQNLAAIPAMATAQLAGMLMVPASFASSAAADALGGLAALGAEVLVRSADAPWVPMLAWRVPRPASWAVVGYYTGLVTWIVWRRLGVPRSVARAIHDASVALTCACGAWIAFAPWTLVAGRGDGHLHVTFVDVGQGDAALVRFPRGSTMLVDAGGGGVGYDVGDRIVGPVMRQLAVQRLDTLVLTHGDADHVGGAASVLRDFETREVWEGVPVPRLTVLNSLRTDAARHRTRWTIVQRGDATVIDGVRVVVHHPQLPDWERQSPRNDDSIVLELRWGDVSIVLAGDIEREAEAAIAERFDAVGIRVLKIPHHGSLSSSTPALLDRLRPEFAVVSAGRGNPFGHPAPAVIERYRTMDTEIFRTDEDGAVEVDTDGLSLQIHGFTGRSSSRAATRLRARSVSCPASGGPFPGSSTPWL